MPTPVIFFRYSVAPPNLPSLHISFPSFSFRLSSLSHRPHTRHSQETNAILYFTILYYCTDLPPPDSSPACNLHDSTTNTLPLLSSPILFCPPNPTLYSAENSYIDLHIVSSVLSHVPFITISHTRSLSISTYFVTFCLFLFRCQLYILSLSLSFGAG